ncbi:MAG: hypothetical protein AB1631_21245 [Acidobacteriota bacterium]
MAQIAFMPVRFIHSSTTSLAPCSTRAKSAAVGVANEQRTRRFAAIKGIYPQPRSTDCEYLTP